MPCTYCMQPGYAIMCTHTWVLLYRCPYYRTAEQELWGRLLDVSSPEETKYWSSLANVAVDSSTCDSTFVQVTTL